MYCCKTSTSTKKRSSITRSAWLAGIISTTALLIPKCPLCISLYLAATAGLTSADYCHTRDTETSSIPLCRSQQTTPTDKSTSVNGPGITANGYGFWNTGIYPISVPL